MKRRVNERATQVYEALDIFRERLARPTIQQALGVRAYLLGVISEMLYVPEVVGDHLATMPHHEDMDLIPLIGMHEGEVLLSSMTQPLPVQKALSRLMVIDSWNRQQQRYTQDDIDRVDHMMVLGPDVLEIPMPEATLGVTTRLTVTRRYRDTQRDAHEWVFVTPGRPHIGVRLGTDAYTAADTIAHEVSHAVDKVLMPGNLDDLSEQEKHHGVSELTALATQAVISRVARQGRPRWRRPIPYDHAADAIEAIRRKHNGTYDSPDAFVLTDELQDDVKKLGIEL